MTVSSCVATDERTLVVPMAGRWYASLRVIWLTAHRGMVTSPSEMIADGTPS